MNKSYNNQYVLIINHYCSILMAAKLLGDNSGYNYIFSAIYLQEKYETGDIYNICDKKIAECMIESARIIIKDFDKLYFEFKENTNKEI